MVTSNPRQHPSNERGIALVAALMVLMFTAILVATYMSTTVGEGSLASNVHIARGALLSTDAGVRAMQQVLANTAQTKLDSALAVWPGTGPVISQPQNLFPVGLTTTTCTSPNYSASGSISFSDSTLLPSSQSYDYLYSITASGGFGALGSRKVQSQGILRVSASRGSFADYLVFTDTHLMPDGSAIWFSSSVSFDGRVHSNGTFRFAYAPTFLDAVTTANDKAYFYNKGNPKYLAADHYSTIDVPNFYGGFTRSAAAVPLPADAFNQQNAALGLTPSGTSPSNSTINTILGTGAGSSTPPNGMYLVRSGTTVTGGLYVQGNLDQMLCSVDGSGNQVYTAKQGSVTRTYTINRTANTTTVAEGASSTTYTGVPRSIVYVNGQVTDLRGPDRVSGTPPPAIADENQLLITATSDVIIKRDLTYHDFHDGNSVLGIFSTGGSVRVGSGAPNDMYLDAYVMATGSGGVFAVDNYDSGSPRGTFHLRGGMVSRYYGAFYTFNASGQLQTGYARDFEYDRRGLIPSYYPNTLLFTADDPRARTMVWKEI